MVISGPTNLDPIGPTGLRNALSGTAVRRSEEGVGAPEQAEIAQSRVKNLLETGLRLNNQQFQQVEAEVTRTQIAGQGIRTAIGRLEALREQVEGLPEGAPVPTDSARETLNRIQGDLGARFQEEPATPTLNLASLGLSDIPERQREEALVRIDEALSQLDSAAGAVDQQRVAEEQRIAALNVERENLNAPVTGRVSADVEENLARVQESLPTQRVGVNVGRESVLALIT